jgi:two-component system, NtrC family, sensor histidine kinase HydH
MPEWTVKALEWPFVRTAVKSWLWDERAARFAFRPVALAAVLIAANALLFSYIASGMVERRILARDANVSSQYVNSIVRLAGAVSYFHGDAFNPKAPEMEAFFRQVSGLPEVLGANVYGFNRTVLWSSDNAQIGKRYLDITALEAAFRGELHPEIESAAGDEDDSDGEHVDFPHGVTDYIETYVPIWSADGKSVAGAVEVYRSAVSILGEIRAVRHVIWLGSAIGAAVLFLTLTAIVVVAKRLVAQQQRRVVESEKYAVIGELTAAVAHSLRNPLASIRSSAELALDGDLPESAREPISDIVGQSERLELWIRSFLADPRAASGRAAGPSALDRVIEECLRGFAAQAQARSIRLSFTPSGPGPRVAVKPAELSQVITSLVANSMEAIGSGGEIIVRRSDSGGQATVTIEDNGPGVAPEMQGRLFSEVVTGKKSGLGVGLTLVKRIVDRCGGTVELMNRKIRGARVTLSLPIQGVPLK